MSMHLLQIRCMSICCFGVSRILHWYQHLLLLLIGTCLLTLDWLELASMAARSCERDVLALVALLLCWHPSPAPCAVVGPTSPRLRLPRLLPPSDHSELTAPQPWLEVILIQPLQKEL